MMKLFEFPHSHYCEKARWALDYHRTRYQAIAILPGLHLWTVRQYAPKTFVPVLLDETCAIQGSSEIIDYLDNRSTSNLLTPENDQDRLECAALENDLDLKLGVPIRQILYHRLLGYPNFIRFCFTHTMPTFKKLAFRMYYPALRKLMYQVYVKSDAEVEQAKRIFDRALDDLGERLKDNEYLIGGGFSRADLTACSMLSLLVLPKQHPMLWPATPDPQIKAFRDSYTNHPVYSWVKKIYENHR